MKTFIPIVLLATTLNGCLLPGSLINYHSTGGLDHSSSAMRTHFGSVHVWNGVDASSGYELAFIPAADETFGSIGPDGSLVQDSSSTPGGSNAKYLLLAPQLLHSGSDSTIANFDIAHGISLRDTDAWAFLAALNSAANMPANDSSYFRYSCQAMLDVTPTAVTVSPRGYTSVTTGLVPNQTWFTTCELSFYRGSGVLTLADGTTWQETIPIDKNNIVQMIPVLKEAIADLSHQR